MRQLDILPPKQLAPVTVTVIGAGGIGSPVLMSLAKMGLTNIDVFDPDVVESHNLPNQLLPVSSVGSPKVEGIKQVLQDFTSTIINIHQKVYDGSTPQAKIVISGVDTMSARFDIWDMVKSSPHQLYIDARMGLETGRIYCLDPLDKHAIQCYEDTLVPDDDMPEIPCTARAVIYTSVIEAGFITRLVGRWVRIRNGNERGDVLPFLTNLFLDPRPGTETPPVFEQTLTQAHELFLANQKCEKEASVA